MIGPRLAIRNVAVCADPEASREEGQTLLLEGDRISEIRSRLAVPPETPTIDGTGATLVAGFWNVHVHFTEPKWAPAATESPQLLAAGLREMLTSRGFTSVVDLGSDPRSTIPLRARVSAGEVPGPTIRTAGTPIYPPHGLPYYVRRSLAPEFFPLLPQPAEPDEVPALVRANLEAGADVIKLFTGSYVARGSVTPMPEAVARAAAEAAHERGRLVFSHPSNLAGTRVALAAGVDVLAHPPDTTDGVDARVVEEIVGSGTALVPTLQMFASEIGPSPAYMDPIVAVVRRFRDRGGRLLFGTDVGFLTEYATDGEFRWLSRVGLTGRELLRMLTVAPAELVAPSSGVGRVVEGGVADLVLLDGDPVDDPSALARVRTTIRSGRVVFDRG
jgi:imidazolonepropionase-like amidohydrolase